MSTIHSAGHGLVAGDRVYFGNLLPTDCGLVEGATYFVLAAGLTTDDFEVSDTDGGTAITLAFDIDSGIVSKVAVYTAIADPTDVMAPPDLPVTPAAPTLDSSVQGSLVRLEIAL